MTEATRWLPGSEEKVVMGTVYLMVVAFPLGMSKIFLKLI